MRIWPNRLHKSTIPLSPRRWFTLGTSVAHAFLHSRYKIENKNKQSTIHIASQVVHPEIVKCPVGVLEWLQIFAWGGNKLCQPLDNNKGTTNPRTYGNHYKQLLQQLITKTSQIQPCSFTVLLWAVWAVFSHVGVSGLLTHRSLATPLPAWAWVNHRSLPTYGFNWSADRCNSATYLFLRCRLAVALAFLAILRWVFFHVEVGILPQLKSTGQPFTGPQDFRKHCPESEEGLLSRGGMDLPGS